MLNFSGIWVPLVTPFNGGQVDLPSLKRLVAHLADAGVAGFIACGSTGEAAMLSEEEEDAVLATTIESAGDRPVLMGLAGVCAETLAARARDLARQYRVNGYLLSAPAYVRPPQAGLLQHFLRVADASPVPIVVYDIPSRTGVRIEPQTLLALAAHPRIQAVKDCSSDTDAAMQLIADGRLAWLAGNDSEMFAQMALGGAGAIAAAAHFRPDLFVRLHQLLQRQALQEAQRLWQALQPLTRVVFAEPNPMLIKAALARQGLLRNELRRPMVTASEAAVDTVMGVLNTLDKHWPQASR